MHIFITLLVIIIFHVIVTHTYVSVFFVFGFNRKGWVSYSIVVEEIKDVDYTGTDVGGNSPKIK